MNNFENKPSGYPHCIDCAWLDTSCEVIVGDFCRRTGSVPDFIEFPRTKPACVHFLEVRE